MTVAEPESGGRPPLQAQTLLPDKKPEWHVLMVHRNNARAIRLYEQCGFELIPDVVRRNDHLVMKLAIGE